MMLLSTMAAMSCSQALLDDGAEHPDGNGRIIITGMVADVADQKPIEGIRISFEAFPDNSISIMPIVSKTVYSDSEGIFAITVEGLSRPVTCRVFTGETHGETQYETQTNEIKVSWSGTAYDHKTETFIVNDCNFLLSPSTL